MLTYIYLIAITAEAMSGALAAGRRNMDLFGVALIAFITALGGGTVRDMLLGNYPVTWTQHPPYIYLTIGSGLATMLVARFMQKLNQVFLVLDAMGLVAFTIIGCNVAQVLRHELYASVSLVVAIIYLVLMWQGVSDDINTAISFSFGLALRLAAIRWKLSLPVFSYSPGRWGD